MVLIAAYRNINKYGISVAGLSNEKTIEIPSTKCIAGNYSSYVDVIPGFVYAAADYTTLPSSDVVYVEAPYVSYLNGSGLVDYANNAAAKAAGLVAGNMYYTTTAGEHIVKVAY